MPTMSRRRDPPGNTRGAEELGALRPVWVLMENVMPEPRTAEEWTKYCFAEGHLAGIETPYEDWKFACACCLRAYARQQVGVWKESALQWLKNEDMENDPDDLYTGRRHRLENVMPLVNDRARVTGGT